MSRQLHLEPHVSSTPWIHQPFEKYEEVTIDVMVKSILR